MNRQSAKLSFIVERAKRKETYKKKKRGVLKDLKELTILCGVEACAAISSEFESEPVFWPSKEGFQSLYEESMAKQVKGNREREMTILMYDILAGKSGLENLTIQDLYDLKQVFEKTKQHIGKIMQLKQNGADQVSTGTDDAGILAGGPTKN